MENEQKTVQSDSKIAKSWTNLVSFVLSLLAIGFLFLPLLKYEISDDVDGFYFMWDLLAASTFQHVFVVAFALLIIAAPLVKIGEKIPSCESGAVLALLLGAAFLFLVPNSYNETMGAKTELFTGLALSFSFAIASAVFAISHSFQKMPMTVRSMAEDAILVAAAFALNFLKIPTPIATTGGSINLQMLPLLVIALRHGPFHGLVAGGIVYGLLTCFTDGYGFACYPFDYLIGFGSVAVLGFFKPLIMGKDQDFYNIKGEIFIAVGGILVTFVRLLGSSISSVVLWGSTFDEALIYNASYIPASGFTAVVILMAIYGPLLKVNKHFPIEEQGN